MKKFVYIFLILAIPLSLNAYTFTRTMSVGSEGQDVLELQKYLNQNPATQVDTFGPGSPGNESTFFGPKTKQAVIRLQNIFADTILKPHGLAVGTGFVGQSTIAFLNNTLTVNPQTPVAQGNLPIIESVSPETLSGTQTITLTGKNFTDANTIIIGFESKDDYINIPSSNNGTTIEFELTSKIQKVFDENYEDLPKESRKRVIEQFPSTPIAVSVITSAGQSNFKIINFKLQ